MTPTRSILLVEDTLDDEELTLLAFRKSGIDVPITVAHDGEEALILLHGVDGRGGSVEPGVILLDLKLPKVDGLEVLRRIRMDARTKFIPVVILSSSSEETDLHLSYTFGANSYVRKPVHFGEFAETIQQLGQYWLGLNVSTPRKAVP